MDIINTIGRRKKAIARIYLSPGKGQITVNNLEYTDFFGSVLFQNYVTKPLKLVEKIENYDIKSTVNGGGKRGQAEALMLAISRALVKADAEEYKPLLKSNGMLTRDPREVERKKPGQPKARKKFQFSKR
jgi:small subunit ribosomal protein S9